MDYCMAHWFLFLMLTVVFSIIPFGAIITAFVSLDKDSGAGFATSTIAGIVSAILASVTFILFLVGVIMDLIHHAAH